jgi:hypothetical protein
LVLRDNYLFFSDLPRRERKPGVGTAGWVVSTHGFRLIRSISEFLGTSKFSQTGEIFQDAGDEIGEKPTSVETAFRSQLTPADHLK